MTAPAYTYTVQRLPKYGTAATPKEWAGIKASSSREALERVVCGHVFRLTGNTALMTDGLTYTVQRVKTPRP